MSLYEFGLVWLEKVGTVLRAQTTDDDHLGTTRAVDVDADAPLVGVAGGRVVLQRGQGGTVGREGCRGGEDARAVGIAALGGVDGRDKRPGARGYVVDVDVGHDGHLGLLLLVRHGRVV